MIGWVHRCRPREAVRAPSASRLDPVRTSAPRYVIHKLPWNYCDLGMWRRAQRGSADPPRGWSRQSRSGAVWAGRGSIKRRSAKSGPHRFAPVWPRRAIRLSAPAERARSWKANRTQASMPRMLRLVQSQRSRWTISNRWQRPLRRPRPAPQTTPCAAATACSMTTSCATWRSRRACRGPARPRAQAIPATRSSLRRRPASAAA